MEPTDSGSRILDLHGTVFFLPQDADHPQQLTTIFRVDGHVQWVGRIFRAPRVIRKHAVTDTVCLELVVQHCFKALDRGVKFHKAGASTK